MILLSNWYMYYGAGAGGVNFKLPPTARNASKAGPCLTHCCLSTVEHGAWCMVENSKKKKSVCLVESISVELG